MILKEACLEAKLILPEPFYPLAEEFSRILLSWNNVHNLSGAKEASQVYEHIIDSVYPVTFLPPFKRALDIGSGAGFPGLVLAMERRDAHFTLVEPLQKRASFLQFVAATLRLENVTVRNCRIEQVPPEPFDLVTSRAVTSAGDVFDWARPFLGEGSWLLLYKSEAVLEELNGLPEARIVRRDHSHYVMLKRE